MRLVLHLLRKDIRQWWYEIIVTLTVLFTAAFTAVKSGTEPIVLGISFVFSCLSPVLLILLVGRVVQAERWPSPVEDWRTRPISRLHFLSAKVLFLCLFSVLPCWLGYLVVFRGMGLSTGMWLRESPVLLCGALVLLILPSAAVMAVTTNLGQAILTAVGMLLGMALVSSSLSWHDFSAAPPNWRLTMMMLALFGAVAVATLYLQLLRNRTWMARGVLVLGWMMLACLASWRPFWDSTTVRDWLSPIPETLRPMTVQVSQPERHVLSVAPGSRADIVLLQFSTEFAGLPEDAVIEGNTGSAIFHTADGSTYRFGLMHGPPTVGTRWSYTLAMPRRQSAMLRAQPVDVDLQFWAYVYLNPTSYSATVRDRRIKVGDLFECSPDPLMRNSAGIADVTCSSANSNLRRLDFTWPKETGTVLLPVTAYGDSRFDFFRCVGGRALQRTIYSGNLTPFWQDGTQMQVRHYQTVHQWHKTVHLSNVRLDDYRQTE